MLLIIYIQPGLYIFLLYNFFNFKLTCRLDLAVFVRCSRIFSTTSKTSIHNNHVLNNTFCEVTAYVIFLDYHNIKPLQNRWNSVCHLVQKSKCTKYILKLSIISLVLQCMFCTQISSGDCLCIPHSK